MAIGSASERGNVVTVYSERGGQLFQRNGSLRGYTSDSVTVRNGRTDTTYDGRGSLKFSRAV